MRRPSDAAPAGIGDSLLKVYAINDAMNQLLLSHLDRRAWRAEPPGQKRNGRTIAAIFAHLHNIRVSWLRNSAPHLKRPAPLDPHRCTMQQAATAHKKSAAQCLRMLTDALSENTLSGDTLSGNTLSGDAGRRVTKFVRDSYVPALPADGVMFAYMFSHEAHHRGQILLLAHQLGYRLPVEAAAGIWWWPKLWKQGKSGRARG